ncbi:uncharacterized protein LOC113568688 isoform X2 [Electrophorus electricus]|uniref:uncharacterized protein LOC113568688 isoform X2 n=1 Tax=Electrophorus electricus TaxID=8005 RepID=UPI0015CF85AA|nr:uncharacterized protein LOC113568688 isoform X2 [Electrophorus electricus]
MSTKALTRMKKIIVQGKPHLCLFAIRDIMPGEEITYDYGGSDWPWRKKSTYEDTATMMIDMVETIGPVTNAEASSLDLKPAYKNSANMMDVVESIYSASGPVTNAEISCSGLKPGESTPKHGKTRIQALCSFATPPPPGLDAAMSLPHDNTNQVDEDPDQVVRSDENVRGPSKKTPWNSNEVCAVEKHMMGFMRSWTVPGKAECVCTAWNLNHWHLKTETD